MFRKEFVRKKRGIVKFALAEQNERVILMNAIHYKNIDNMKSLVVCVNVKIMKVGASYAF